MAEVVVSIVSEVDVVADVVDNVDVVWLIPTAVVEDVSLVDDVVVEDVVVEEVVADDVVSAVEEKRIFVMHFMN